MVGRICLIPTSSHPSLAAAQGHGWGQLASIAKCLSGSYLLSPLAAVNAKGHPAKAIMPCPILVTLLLGAAVSMVPVTSCPEKTPLPPLQCQTDCRTSQGTGCPTLR